MAASPPSKRAVSEAKSPSPPTVQPLLDITSTRTAQYCRELKGAPGLGDIFICSYPKSGTTWMQHIVLSLVARCEHSGHVADLAPFFEADATWEAPPEGGSGKPQIRRDVREKQTRAGWRVFNTHLWWRSLPKHKTAKYIYVCRNGRDSCVSFYHHLSKQLRKGSTTTPVVDTDFKTFHRDWLEGKIPYGRWIDHIASFDEPLRDRDPRILVLRYEDMVRDLRTQVGRLATFLGTRFSGDAKTKGSPEGMENAPELDKLLETFTFQWMREHSERFQPTSVRWLDKFQFLRKGKVGDAKALYGPAEEAGFDAAIRSVYSNGVLPVWAREKQ